MSPALSSYSHNITLTIVGVVIVSFSGCRPSYPVVVNSTEPWEDELARERQAARNAEAVSPQASVAQQRYGRDQENDKEPEHSAVVVAVTDIIAFPFRGAGWLARQIF